MKHTEKNLVLSTELIKNIGHRQKIKKSCASLSSERIKKLWVVCGSYTDRHSYTIGGNMVTRKKKCLVENVRFLL